MLFRETPSSWAHRWHSGLVLVGRDVELDHLVALLDEAQAGRSAVLRLVGEPGIGKTALIEAVASLAHPEAFTWPR